MGTAADRQTQWTRLVIDSFVRAGVDHAVISPGSRSTPFVIAALQRQGLECVSAIDERSAAHYALGRARATLRPSLLLCTSGSAAANYFPAVMEANEAGVPVVVLSADRPPELHHCGANQTTDQVGLFGTHVRFFADLGEPRSDEQSLHALRRLIAQSVAAATAPAPGPVHLNAQARKPLEPIASATELRTQVDRIASEPMPTVWRARSYDSDPCDPVPPRIVDAVVEALDSASRPILLCGPSDWPTGRFAGAADELAARAGALILAETSSQLRHRGLGHVLGGFDTTWRAPSGRQRCLPDFVLQLGAAPVSKGWEQLCAAGRIRRLVVHPWKWVDPTSDAEAIVQCDVGSLLAALRDARYHAERRDVAFVERFKRAEATVWNAVEDLLSEDTDTLTEPAATRAVVESLPRGSAFVLGNSLPIRDVDTWAPPSDKMLDVFHQRGVSGIDGVVSGAAGVASGTTGPTTLLVGDVSFLHDLNGLQLAGRAEHPLVVVVIHNGGGRIFDQLPVAQSGEPPWLRYFTTPHDVDFEKAVAAFGCRFIGVRTVSDLRRALPSAYARAGCTVIEARVVPESARELGSELVARVERKLAAGAS